MHQGTRLSSLLVIAALLGPSKAGAVIGTEVLGMGSVPERVNITFPDGTVQTVDPSTPRGPLFILQDNTVPGAARLVFDFPVTNGVVAITGVDGEPLTKLVFENGRVNLDANDPHALADYLRGLEEQAQTDLSAYERYHEVWNSIPETLHESIYDIWDAQDAAAQVTDDAASETSTTLDGQQWAANTADVLVGAHLADETGPLAQAGEGIQRSREHYAAQIATLRSDAQRLSALVQDAKRTEDAIQADLTSHLNTFSWWTSFVFRVDARTGVLEGKLADAKTRTLVLKGQLAATVTSLQNLSADARRHEEALTLDAVRNDPALLEQASQQRFDEAVALSQELAIKKQQFVDGYSAFQGQLNALDTKIAQGRQYGLDTAVTQWETDKVSVQSTFDLWQAGMQTAIEARGWDLTQAFARNHADGFGPTDMNVLRIEVVTRGLDVGVLEFTADQLATFRGGVAGPAVGIATGAGGLDVEQYDWRDFAHDYSNEFYVTFGNWNIATNASNAGRPNAFTSRYGAYWAGVGRAAKDGVYDMFELGREGIDTVFEANEAAINFYAGTNSNVFGGENLQVTYDFANSASNLDNEFVYQTTQGVIRWADRRFEMQAGSGEKGLLQGLGDVGYVVGTVVGVEEAAPRLVIAGVRGTKVIYAGRVIDAAVDTASAGTDASRVINRSADASRVTQAGGAAVDAERATNVLDDAADIGRLDATPVPVGPAPLPSAPGLIGTRGGEVTIARGQNGALTLTHSDGYTLELLPEHRIGGGATSEVYAHPNNPNLVIKVTEAKGGAGIALDNFGYKALQDVDRTKLEIPGVHAQFPITAGERQGGVVSIVDRAPKTIKDSPDILVNGDLTPGQVRAYQAGYGELTARGLVLLDTKWDNWALRQVGPGDDWVLVGVDLGSVVPVVGRDPQVAGQLARTLHTATPPFRVDPQFLPGYIREELGEQFNGVIDWDAFNRGTGGSFGSLSPKYDEAGDPIKGVSVPYNPIMAVQYPSLQRAFAPDVPLPIGVLPASVANLSGDAFRSAPTALETGFGTLPPNYFRFADTALDTAGSGTLVPNYFRDAPTVIDGAALTGRPGALIHIDVNPLRNLETAVGPNLLPFLARRFVIGACDFSAPDTCVNATGVAVFSFPPAQALALGQELQMVHGIKHFELNSGRIEQARLNDPLLHTAQFDQWAIARVGFENEHNSAWDAAAAKNPVTVAVIDSGVAWGHADLGPEQLWVNRGEMPGNRIDDDKNGYVDDIAGWNFVDDNNLPWDVDGHGTLVAGVIAARSNNGLGIAGINQKARIMALRALDHAGQSRASHVAEAVTYATNNGAKVINLSVGGVDLTETERLAIAYAYSQGVVIVIAAGNESIDVAGYGPPGNSPDAIIVAASDRDDARLAVSNWGWLVDVAAPGVDVVGTRAIGTDLMLKFPDIKYEPGSQIVGADGAYYRATGTSFAAPIVAGTASLMLSARPELTPREVERMIRNSARDIGAPGIDHFTGYGLLDARAALKADPKFFLEGQINGVRVAQRDGKAYLDVLGFVQSDALDSATVEIGVGETPTAWKRVGNTEDDEDDLLASIESTAFRDAKAWTLRLVARHRNGAEREARFAFNVN